ncbi:hypothetical protein [Dactylosporangium sp. NPDC050588]|uniref:hypothetical protein n=1 Tax=Dactylosporangium sp. NPDC050588 TaxID=3157211 RepID=UPI0033DEC2EE
MTALLIHLQAAGTSLVLDARGPRPLGGPPRTVQDRPPAWLLDGGITLPGRLLAEVGLPAPLLAPQQAAVFEVVAA